MKQPGERGSRGVVALGWGHCAFGPWRLNTWVLGYLLAKGIKQANTIRKTTLKYIHTYI